VQTCCSGLPAWLPIKEIPEKPGHQLAASDVHRHTPRENNLNYTIWTLYAESISSSINATLLWGAPIQDIKQHGALPLQFIKQPGAHSLKSVKQLETCPLQSIKQLWARPLQSGKQLGRTLSNLLSNLGCTHLPTSQTICQELKVRIAQPGPVRTHALKGAQA
jgi:hypothetical protein